MNETYRTCSTKLIMLRLSLKRTKIGLLSINEFHFQFLGFLQILPIFRALYLTCCLDNLQILIGNLSSKNGTRNFFCKMHWNRHNQEKMKKAPKAFVFFTMMKNARASSSKTLVLNQRVNLYNIPKKRNYLTFCEVKSYFQWSTISN